MIAWLFRLIRLRIAVGLARWVWGMFRGRAR